MARNGINYKYFSGELLKINTCQLNFSLAMASVASVISNPIYIYIYIYKMYLQFLSPWFLCRWPFQLGAAVGLRPDWRCNFKAAWHIFKRHILRHWMRGTDGGGSVFVTWADFGCGGSVFGTWADFGYLPLIACFRTNTDGGGSVFGTWADFGCLPLRACFMRNGGAVFLDSL